MMEAVGIMAFLLAVSFLGKNYSVAISVVVLLAFMLVAQQKLVSLIESYGLKIGIIILTIGVLAPIASGKLTLNDIVNTTKSSVGLIAILTGIFVAFLGGKGVKLLSSSPEVVTGLVIGTVIGVAFFKGVPVGPLIAAGIMSIFYGLMK